MLAAEFAAIDRTGSEAPGQNYNVAPTDPVVAVLDRHPRDDAGVADPTVTERSLRVLRWGLIPHWAKDAREGAKMINARAETVRTKPAFKAAVRRRRCVLPADGWYEWRAEADAAGKVGKQPFFMTRSDDRSLALAGIWASRRDPATGQSVVSAAVLTTEAVGPPAEVHERMPLVLGDAELDAWLDPDREAVDELLDHPGKGYAQQLELRPVANLVNSVRNNGPQLVARAHAAQAQTLFGPQ